MAQREATVRRGIVWVQMTAQEMITMAVNNVQNCMDEAEPEGEDLRDGLSYARNETKKAMLREVYELLLDANRRAVSRRGHRKRK